LPDVGKELNLILGEEFEEILGSAGRVTNGPNYQVWSPEPRSPFRHAPSGLGSPGTHGT
jgi:hypothetical protein